jgi:hypothetical protein
LQDFAIAKSSPWAIAWLVIADDWNHLEKVIHHNCTLLGGTDNILIPVSADGVIWPGYELFLALYDPDFIVLAPGISSIALQSKTLPLTPFGIVAWNQVSQIVSADTSWTSGQAAQIQSFLPKGQQEGAIHELVAVADSRFPDTSRLALLACGDVRPADLDPYDFNGEVYFEAHGYREDTLRRLAVENRRAEVSAQVGDYDEWLPAPSRQDLATIIDDENKFPLVGAAEILEACASLQHLTIGRRSFINRTATRRGSRTPPRRASVSTLLAEILPSLQHPQIAITWFTPSRNSSPSANEVIQSGRPAATMTWRYTIWREPTCKASMS